MGRFCETKPKWPARRRKLPNELVGGVGCGVLRNEAGFERRGVRDLLFCETKPFGRRFADLPNEVGSAAFDGFIVDGWAADLGGAFLVSCSIDLGRMAGLGWSGGLLAGRPFCETKPFLEWD